MNPGKIFTEKIGFSQEQYDALGGMECMIPRGTLWRLRKKKSAEITRKVRDQIAPAIKAQSSDFADALNTQEVSHQILKNRFQLVLNSIKIDETIGKKTNDPELIEFAKSERESFDKISGKKILIR